MTAKEKALELVDTYCRAKLDNGIIGIYQPLAKQCALICVDEMLEFAYYIEWEKKEEAVSRLKFLNEVKQEINKL